MGMRREKARNARSLGMKMQQTGKIKIRKDMSGTSRERTGNTRTSE